MMRWMLLRIIPLERGYFSNPSTLAYAVHIKPFSIYLSLILHEGMLHADDVLRTSEDYSLHQGLCAISCSCTKLCVVQWALPALKEALLAFAAAYRKPSQQTLPKVSLFSLSKIFSFSFFWNLNVVAHRILKLFPTSPKSLKVHDPDSPLKFIRFGVYKVRSFYSELSCNISVLCSLSGTVEVPLWTQLVL